MSVKLHKKFIQDLDSVKDNVFFRQLASAAFSTILGKENKQDDHRYKGIKNAWIRKVSGRPSSLRIIYVREGDSITLVRGGQHDIEDNLNSIDMSESNLYDLDWDESEILGENEMPNPHEILSNHEGKRTFPALVGRSHYPCKEVFLISPYISIDLIKPHSPIGRTLNTLVENGAEVVLVTRSEAVLELADYHRNLERRGIDLYFYPNLHSKIYLFLLKRDEYRCREEPDFAIIGSSNLTKNGISAYRDTGNYETNYTVPPEGIANIHAKALHIYSRSIPFNRAIREQKKKIRIGEKFNDQINSKRIL